MQLAFDFIRDNGALTILSLFDFTGNWPAPYKEIGFDVIQLDIKLGNDVLTFDPSTLPPIYGILAAPPCTHFSASGAVWWAEKDADGRTAQNLALIDRTMEIVEFLRQRDNIAFWALENPVGRLSRLRPKIGKPWYFQPHWYAGLAPDPQVDRYTKKTGLWGDFNRNLEKSNLDPIWYYDKRGNRYSKLHFKYGGKSEKTKTARSTTPLGFARAFCKANSPT